MSGPDARSELFLSCDLVGSTALKQRSGSKWEEIFLAFYLEFPQMLGEVAEEDGVAFELWKPIGDELVYKVRVKCEAEIKSAVRVWLKAMHNYESDPSFRRNVAMRTKGGAFIGTFPGPDVEASALRNPGERLSTSLDLAEINDDALKGRHHDRHIFDYFGPSFDTGFRVINQSTPRHFTLAVEVAWAMLRAEDDVVGHNTLQDLTYLGPRELKGVWGGRDYPLFAIDRDFEDDINLVMKKLGPGDLNQADAKLLCETCVMASDLPTALFLPDSTFEFLKEEPRDALQALRRQTNETGIEKSPSEAEENKGSEELPEVPPFGDVYLDETEAAERLGIPLSRFLRFRETGFGPLSVDFQEDGYDDRIVTLYPTDELDSWAKAMGDLVMPMESPDVPDGGPAETGI